MSEQTENPVVLNEEEPIVHDTLSAMREYSSRYVSDSPANAFRFMMDFMGVDEKSPEPTIPELFGQLADKIDSEYIPRDVYNAIVEQREAVGKQVEAAEAKTRAIEAQIASIAQERDARHSKNLRYKNDCSTLQRKCDKLAADVAVATHERDSYHEKLDLLTEKHNQVTHELETSRSENDALKSSCSQLREDLAASEQSNQDAQTRTQDLLAEIERLNNSSDASDAQLVELTRSQSALQQNVETLTEERDNALRECNVTKQRLRELAAQYQSATDKSQEIESAQIAQAQYEARIDELTHQIGDFQEQIGTLKERLQQAETNCTQAQENARIAGSREDAIRQELMSIKTERDNAIQQAKEISAQRTSSKQDYDNALMVERGRFNAAMRTIRRKLMDAGVHSSVINVAFAGIGIDPAQANGESIDPEGDIESQRLIDSIFDAAERK